MFFAGRIETSTNLKKVSLNQTCGLDTLLAKNARRYSTTGVNINYAQNPKSLRLLWLTPHLA